MVKNIAIIPARSGSSRIKNKNIYPFMGKPLMAWTIEAAQKSGLFDRIIVSTDSEEYAKIAVEYGAEAPFLRNKYADNASSCSMVALYAAKQAENYYKEVYDKITILQATCPLRDENDIINADDVYKKSGTKVLITATKYTMNPWWGATVDDENKPTFVLYSPAQCSSQSKPPMYCPNGAVVIIDKEYLKKNESIYTDELRFSEMDWKNSVDIDNYDDIEMAEVLYNVIKKVNNV
ncbi:MAG: acylneuraminate cytidylyltransferase family protein [Cyanobacteria bacterium RUI128]|nr:acylneuraminate cytidylyltransferase family protein [Cyanobacteria bacterium RUI128]